MRDKKKFKKIFMKATVGIMTLALILPFIVSIVQILQGL